MTTNVLQIVALLFVITALVIHSLTLLIVGLVFGVLAPMAIYIYKYHLAGRRTSKKNG
jgi:hypothetical protein